MILCRTHAYYISIPFPCYNLLRVSLDSIIKTNKSQMQVNVLYLTYAFETCYIQLYYKE